MPITSWYMSDAGASVDQRSPQQRDPPAPVSRAALAALGVLSWEGLGAGLADAAADPALARIRAERGYSYHDVITISPEKLPNYEEKLKTFYAEHLHTDEEIRLVLEGSGYFDVKDAADRWIRVAMEAGDMIILPAGMYHRFTLDERNYIKAMRLFVGEPVWTAYNRGAEGTDAMPARAAFLTALGGAAAATVASSA